MKLGQKLRAQLTIWQPVQDVGICPGEVLLSFDDGPQPDITPRLLDLLQKSRSPCGILYLRKIGPQRAGCSTPDSDRWELDCESWRPSSATCALFREGSAKGNSGLRYRNRGSFGSHLAQDRVLSSRLRCVDTHRETGARPVKQARLPGHALRLGYQRHPAYLSGLDC